MTGVTFWKSNVGGRMLEVEYRHSVVGQSVDARGGVVGFFDDGVGDGFVGDVDAFVIPCTIARFAMMMFSQWRGVGKPQRSLKAQKIPGD